MDKEWFPNPLTGDYEKLMERLGQEIANPTRYYAEEWESPLYSAVLDNDLEKVKYLIACGVDVNEGHVLGSSPLCIAAQYGYMPIVSYLVEKGADIEKPTSKGLSPLHLAVFGKHDAVTRYLIKQSANVNATDNKGFTPICVAFYNKHTPMVWYLAEHGADVNPPLMNGVTLLLLAVKYGNLETVKCLVEHGAPIATTEQGLNPLPIAIRLENQALVSYLIEKGANIHEVYKNNQTPLLLSILCKKPIIMETLLAAGCDIEQRVTFTSETSSVPSQISPLAYSIAKRGLLMTKCLLEHGADPEGCFAYLTPLTLATTTDKPFIRLLLQYGADINKPDQNGTALCNAIWCGYEKMAK